MADTQLKIVIINPPKPKKMSIIYTPVGSMENFCSYHFNIGSMISGVIINANVLNIALKYFILFQPYTVASRF